MAFNFNSKLILQIEEKMYEVDISQKSVIDAVKSITEKSIAISKLVKADEKYIETCIRDNIEFIQSILGPSSFDEIFKDREISTEDVFELSYYLLDEIGKFKESRLTRYSNLNAPSDLN